ncbi:LysE family translocator [Phytoactinopolyspora halotolerans]|uniref:LysE family translocator n=1 Tax=Phytoactinopolyspora halotolerans TaxID=1981512 RepID=A0A6L9SA72_9ACTN|nr:LysE family translocator [Phytoactinopolyspora halotolerans]NEE01541.1 LysE family translocator [Phytoactinopolyspora halotolerans]
MPSLEHLLAFAVASFVIIIIPGPSVLFVVSRALAYGRRAALISVAGGTTGSFVLAMTVALGVGAIVQASAVAFTTMKLVGAAYLVYLGVRAVQQRHRLRAAFEARISVVGDRRTWWEGFVVGVTNPKTAVFFAAVLPQFVDRSAGHAGLQMVALSVVFAVIALTLDSVWGLAAGTVRTWFARSARRLDLVGGAAGLTMVGLGVGVALTGRKD